MTRQECVELFALLGAAYPKEPMNPAQVALYSEMLREFPTTAVRQAALQHIQLSPFFPRVSDLIERLTKGQTTEAAAAWGEVLEQVRETGYYRAPTWSHAELAEAVRMLGWQAICQSTAPDVIRSHFMRAYEAAMAIRQESGARGRSDVLAPRVREALETVGRVPDNVRSLSRRTDAVDD